MGPGLPQDGNLNSQPSAHAINVQPGVAVGSRRLHQPVTATPRFHNSGIPYNTSHQQRSGHPEGSRSTGGFGAIRTSRNQTSAQPRSAPAGVPVPTSNRWHSYLLTGHDCSVSEELESIHPQDTAETRGSRDVSDPTSRNHTPAEHSNVQSHPTSQIVNPNNVTSISGLRPTRHRRRGQEVRGCLGRGG
ncbi:Protein of unknown function [Pyronema omphalodes CBS 100304]|uniref:Uncharacterized protein n=1 Tax=Pyronema omphalodes (strain CBS 100304) TaxID=1076935 RepID=U4LG40_PYROM|nr:Protein of unknown function [Pyronema omphalodes CBS 100304]